MAISLLMSKDLRPVQGNVYSGLPPDHLGQQSQPSRSVPALLSGGALASGRSGASSVAHSTPPTLRRN